MKKISIILIVLFVSQSLFAQDWTTTESSSQARMYQTVTKLNNDRIIVIGGISLSKDYLTEVEIYNPNTDEWTQVADFPLTIKEHATVCISDSIVMVFGGFTGSVTTDNIYEYNINTDVWTKKHDMPRDLRTHTATVLNDNRVLIIGGYQSPGGDSRLTFVYNPETDSYTQPIELNYTRAGHRAILMNDGKVMVVGAYDNAAWTLVKTCEIYDPETDQWSTAGQLPVGMTGGHRVVKAQDGDILVIGGFDGIVSTDCLDEVQKYDVQTETWSILTNISLPKTMVSCALLEDGNIMIAGGKTSNDDCPTEVVAMNPETGDFTTLNPIPEGRTSAFVNILNDNRVIIMYGYIYSGGSNYYDNGIIYGTATTPLTYNATFHVTEADGTTPINEASITFNNETLLTNSSGEITFTEIEKGNGLLYLIEKTGFTSYNSSVSIQTNDIDIYVSLEEATNIIENKNHNFTIYPNPSKGIFTLDFKTSEGLLNVSITNITGKTIKQFVIPNSQFVIDISNQPAGIYFINIVYAERSRSKTKTGIYTEKLIIK